MAQQHCGCFCEYSWQNPSMQFKCQLQCPWAGKLDQRVVCLLPTLWPHLVSFSVSFLPEITGACCSPSILKRPSSYDRCLQKDLPGSPYILSHHITLFLRCHLLLCEAIFPHSPFSPLLTSLVTVSLSHSLVPPCEWQCEPCSLVPRNGAWRT
jgi:hypothetical protein